MMDIIPAIDLMDGQCVRLYQGDFDQKEVYRQDPVEVARSMESAGMRRLHVVDLDGAKNGKMVNMKTLANIAGNTNLIIDFGGGIKKQDDLEAVFDHGASMVSVGSIAVKEPSQFWNWINKFGTDKFLLGMDLRNEHVSIMGWKEDTPLHWSEFLELQLQHGIEQVFCTDIQKDGAMQGPALELYTRILKKFPELHLIASGGVSQLIDLDELDKVGCKGAIIGKAIYEGSISLESLNTFQNN